MRKSSAVLAVFILFIALVDAFTVAPLTSSAPKTITQTWNGYRSSRSQSAPVSLHADPLPTSKVEETNSVEKKGIAVIAGATGYIGKAVVQESVRQGYETYALVRDKQKVQSTSDGKALYSKAFEGANVVECNVGDLEALTQTFHEITNGNHPSSSDLNGKETKKQIDLLVSCLASRSGVKKEAYAIDYQATLNCLNAGRATDAKHFVLLSAFCVRNPWLQFQQAKLKFEAALQEQTDMTWTIVRPTAFFKSVSGQLENVQSGAPYIMFGDGQVTRCNPIAESELAEYMVDCALEPTRQNKIINLGGPDHALTMRQQGEMIFRATGMEPYYMFAPLWLFDFIIDSLQWLADVTNSEALEDAAETGRIGKYYAVEDMLTTDPKEKYGTITLQEHYNRIAKEGQEYDAVMRKGSLVRTIVGNLGRWYHSLVPQTRTTVPTVATELSSTSSTISSSSSSNTATPAAAFNTTRL